jgi:hypothetical protein
MGEPLAERRTLALLLGVTAVGVLFAPLRGGVLPMDSYWYLEHAMRIFERGDLASFLVRRPAFPAMIAGAFALLGPELQSAFVLSRAFFVAYLALV